jgi:hypothetical protein
MHDKATTTNALLAAIQEVYDELSQHTVDGVHRESYRKAQLTVLDSGSDTSFCFELQRHYSFDQLFDHIYTKFCVSG